jgi:hypothetical protein
MSTFSNLKIPEIFCINYTSKSKQDDQINLGQQRLHKTLNSITTCKQWLRPRKAMFTPINYPQYLRSCCALLCLLLTILYGSPPALATEGNKSSISTSWVEFDQILGPTPWSGFQPGHYGELTRTAAFDTNTSQSGKGYRWEGPPAESPDWRGIKWDTFYFIAYQFVVIGVLYIAPESLSGWTKEDKEDYSFSKWVDNVTNPVWDKDEWWVNYILHPYWGATYYIRGQERGLKKIHSFWYSFLLSSLYEYGAEALFEPVSYQDMIVTPVAGALLGEYLFTPIREWIRAKPGELGWHYKALLLITDPLGVISEETSRLLGVNATVSFRPLAMGSILHSSDFAGETENTLPVNTHYKPVWGVQVKIAW